MAKKVTKTVIEDMAYQLRRVAIFVYAFKHNTMSSESNVLTEQNYPDMDFSDPEDVIDWAIENAREVFAEHDPSFDAERWEHLISYKPHEQL